MIPILAADPIEEMVKSPSFWSSATLILAAIMVFSFLMLLARRFKRCPSNRILVIYGLSSKGGQVRYPIDPGL